jgi:hypothetical protein
MVLVRRYYYRQHCLKQHKIINVFINKTCLYLYILLGLELLSMLWKNPQNFKHKILHCKQQEQYSKTIQKMLHFPSWKKIPSRKIILKNFSMSKKYIIFHRTCYSPPRVFLVIELEVNWVLSSTLKWALEQVHPYPLFELQVTFITHDVLNVFQSSLMNNKRWEAIWMQTTLTDRWQIKRSHFGMQFTNT